MNSQSFLGKVRIKRLDYPDGNGTNLLGETTMVDILGYIASFLFASCAAPQAYKSYKDGHSNGLSHTFLWLWFTGEILAIVYVLFKYVWDGPLMFNYLLNFTFLLILMYYKYRGENKNDTKSLCK